jgi:hypothetical protein
MGFGGVGVPGRGGEHDGAVGQLLIGPAARPAIDRLEQVVSPIDLNTSPGRA